MAERIRIVVAGVAAEPTTDEPERSAAQSATSIARALRDAGSEIVYTGPDQTPEQIVQTVVQEDVDALVAVLDDATPGTVLHRVTTLLFENDAADVVVFAAGGDARDAVAEPGAAVPVTIFPAGAGVDEIVERIHTEVGSRSDA